MKKLILLDDEINQEELCECASILLNSQKEVIVVGDKKISKIQEILSEISDFRGGYDYEITYDCYIEKSKLNEPNVYTTLKKFFKDFPEILERYDDCIELSC
ncbi:MAG: hypothetical protein J6J24_04780 [Clostridia bacterium]|nr:hypothetical protein [Clostridia bacterium]